MNNPNTNTGPGIPPSVAGDGGGAGESILLVEPLGAEPQARQRTVEVFQPGDTESQKRIAEQINNLPNHADRTILTNAFYNFSITPGEIIDSINQSGDPETIRLTVGANFNNTLITLEKMQQEIKQGQDLFASPQYI